MNRTITINKDFPYSFRKAQNSNAVYYFVLFILWPFLAFVVAINNYTEKSARKVVYLFLIYYGLSFVNNNMYIDAFRYALRLTKTAQLPFSDFFIIVGGLYSDTSVDIIEPLSSFIISRFSTSASVYFAFWTAFMGFFYLKSINLLYDRYRKQPGWNGLIIMVFFIFIAPITEISGIRMPTATWIFFYAAYHVVLYRDKRYILLALSSCLVHWSFIPVNILLIAYFFAGNRNIIYLPLAISSFILPNLLAPFIKLISSNMGGAIQKRYKGYSNEDYIAGIEESYETASWFMKIMNDYTFYFLLLALIFIQTTSSNLMKNKSDRNLFSFVLLMISFVNFGKVVPTFGGRFQLLLYLFATLYIFIYFCRKGGKSISIINLVGLFPMLLHILVLFRIGSESINAWIFSPGFGLPLFLPGLSLAELLFN